MILWRNYLVDMMLGFGSWMLDIFSPKCGILSSIKNQVSRSPYLFIEGKWFQAENNSIFFFVKKN